MIKAVLFDLDGVLVEAREWHYVALNKALKEVANTEISREDHESTFNGLPTKHKLNMLSRMGRVKIEDHDKIRVLKQQYTTELIEKAKKEDLEKISMFKLLKNLNYKTACVTNSITKTANLMLSVTGQLNFLDLVISNEMVKKPKPHPEGYIVAMVSLQSLPDETVIVEDSEYGIQAAEAAGAHVMKVTCAADVTLHAVKSFLENNGHK